MFNLLMLLGWVTTAVLITVAWASRRPGHSIVPGVLVGLVSGLLWPVTLWIAVGLWWHQRSRSSSRPVPRGGIVLACIFGSLT